MSGIEDARARATAIDPDGSFCVSAPAGSGKTELLIQRYLALLARVNRPEQVLAITFTRKAAAEMRQRVILALQSALESETCVNPHRLLTRRLAQSVLATDEREGWNLLDNIARFNIKTIDSFCAGLSRQMPVLGQIGGQPRVQDDALPLYAEAVYELFQLLEAGHPIAADLAALMLHFDNNWERLQQLLVAMLGRREQWREYVGVHHEPQESQDYLIATVDAVVSDELAQLAQLLAPYVEQLLELLQFSNSHLELPVPSHFPRSTAADLPGWRRLRELMLNKTGDWRKTVNKRDGFPSGNDQRRARKTQLLDLVGKLEEIPGLQQRLAAVTTLPEFQANSRSWQLVLHLSRLLPTLAAQLLLVFQKHGAVDHSQVAQSALLALGSDDAPTDLAMRLDYTIEHILVDEFQDTAITQYELLQKLTRGWGDHNAQYPDKPRTLMIVGDAMQSIYGFRGANVGLFLKAGMEGFNGVALQQLELLCNFRSDAGVVHWINKTFKSSFPAQQDSYRALVPYSPATATRPAGPLQAVHLHAFCGDDARSREVEFVCTQIASCLASGNETVAVLGRSRNHLQPIIERLRQLQISCNAPDLASLVQAPVVVDLLTLCRALANDADKLAWLALLRAPWCGLQLSDLLSIAQFGAGSTEASIWQILQNEQLHKALSIDGRLRVQQLLPVMQRARDKRDRLSLRVWIEHTWIGLGGEKCLPSIEGLLDAERFLQLLEEAETEGVGLDLEWLQRRLQNSYMYAGDPDSRVHLMTLHKAKGLEFDRIILVQLDRPPRADGRDIMLWDEHSNAHGERAFLLAADDLEPGAAPTLYNYLKSRRQEKTKSEATRLLYVGATRAIRQLCLTACISLDDKTGLPRAPSSHSLLHCIWPVFIQETTVHPSNTTPESGAQSATVRYLTRLKLSHDTQDSARAPVRVTAAESCPAPARPDNYMERCIGTVVHQALEELSRRPALPDSASVQDERRWRVALQRLGLWGDVLEASVQVVQHAIAQTLRPGQIGRWILSPEHQDAHSEWRLTVLNENGENVDIAIDRSFVDTDSTTRWVIDYKTSVPLPDESPESFIQRESDSYFKQLHQYRDAVRHLGAESVRCGLYFVSLGQLHVVGELTLFAEKPLSS